MRSFSFDLVLNYKFLTKVALVPKRLSCVTWQENAVNLLENTANFVSSQLSSGSTDPGVLQDVGASLLHGISNVMSAASTGAQQEEEEEEEEFDDNEDSNKKAEKEKKKAAKGKVILYLYKL